MKIKNNKKALKQKKSRVFPKVFAYTILLVMLICVSAVIIFSREFISFYRAEQRRIYTTAFQPILTTIQTVTTSKEDIIAAARLFAGENESVKFVIQEFEGDTLFSTVDITGSFNEDNLDGLNIRFAGSFNDAEGKVINQYRLIGYSNISDNIGNGLTVLARRIMLALAMMLGIAVFGAVLFAKRITKPLEDEIVRRRIMEENQRLFFSAASHELKTPIASARALVEGMIAGVGDYSDHPKYLRECLNTLDSQGHLVSEILDIVKLSDNETELTFENFDLAEFGNAVLNDYRQLAENKDIIICGEFPHITLNTDRQLFKKVLSNLIANAVQNTQKGHEIRIFTEENKKPRLCILNTGAHIPEDVLTRLFEPFYRQDTARTRSGQTGLGLAIVKKALDRMRFKFVLENTDEGEPPTKLPAVVFRIELPL